MSQRNFGLVQFELLGYVGTTESNQLPGASPIPRRPGIAMSGADVISIAVFQLVNLLDAAPPLRPALGMKNQIPDLLLWSLEAPDGNEFIVGHNLIR